ncbi:MAG TPA: hypothetical protein VFE98_09780 [Candidatus Bathyarchaeia archaeon]|nr:hypothetical protein [Candidatus Bathyarchaeia archaeon]
MQSLGESWHVGDFFQYHYLRSLTKREKERIIKEGRGIVNSKGEMIMPMFTRGPYMSKLPIVSNGKVEAYTSCRNKTCGAWLEALAVIKNGKFVGIRTIKPKKLEIRTRSTAKKWNVMDAASKSWGHKEAKMIAHKKVIAR